MMLWAAVGAVVILAGTAGWYMREYRFAKGNVYVPPHIEDGHIIPAHQDVRK